MRTKGEIIHCGRAHIADACSTAGSVKEAITTLKEAGFRFRRSTVVEAFNRAQAPGLENLDWPEASDEE
jgi:hypothetical protein